MQRLAIVGGVALLALALVVGIALRGNHSDSEEGEELSRRADPSSLSKSGGEASSSGSGKSSRTRNARVPEAPIYSGPRGMAGWVQDFSRKENLDTPWKFVDGKMISSRRGGIAREMAAPPRSKISFHLEWGKSLRFRILMGSDEGDTTQPDNCYDLVMQSRLVYFRKRWETRSSGGSRIVGQANVTALAENESAFFEFYLDRELGLITFYVNGERAHIWTDADPALGKFGDWLHFVSERFYPLEISQLKVESWNGLFPDGTTGKEWFEEQEARRKWVESLRPVAPWAPESEYHAAVARARGLQLKAARTDDPEDHAAAAEATMAFSDAKIRYDQALKDLPVAKPDPERSSHVFNPYTGQSLDRRGVRGGTRVRDPNDPKGERTFRVP